MGLIHEPFLRTNLFVSKSYLRRFYEDCGIHEFSYAGFFLGKNRSYEHSGVLLCAFQCRHVGMLVSSSFVMFNKIHYSDISVIFMYLFFHFIFLFIFHFNYRTLNVPTLESSTLETMPSISDPTLFIAGGISPSTAYKTIIIYY